MTPPLKIQNLSLAFGKGRDRVQITDGVSLSVGAGEIVALVGESGAGKSATALSVAGLLGPQARIETGSIEINGQDIAPLRPKALNEIRGRQIGFIFQEPMSSLNPLMTIGDQITEPLTRHLRLSRGTARTKAADLLASVGFPSPETRLDDYPHQLSGGQRQRVMIAIAISCGPSLLVADEPTTALDVTTQAQVLTLLDQLRRDSGMGVLLITHDLGVVDSFADRVAIMYAGRIVEQGPTREVFAAPEHPYTRLLLKSLPRISQKLARLPVIEGSPPSPRDFPDGCRFHPRCPEATPGCSVGAPTYFERDGRGVACLRSSFSIKAYA